MSRNGSQLFTILRSSSAASKSAPANTRTKFVPSPIYQQQRKQELKRQTRHKYAFTEKSIIPHYTMHKKSFFGLPHYPITAIKNNIGANNSTRASNAPNFVMEAYVSIQRGFTFAFLLPNKS